MRLSIVKAHSSFGIGEKLHGPLRGIFLKVKHAHPHMPNRYSLSVAVKAMNDTMNENGLVSSRLILGMLPRFPIINTALPTQKDRINAIKNCSSRNEFDRSLMKINYSTNTRHTPRSRSNI